MRRARTRTLVATLLVLALMVLQVVPTTAEVARHVVMDGQTYEFDSSSGMFTLSGRTVSPDSDAVLKVLEGYLQDGERACSLEHVLSYRGQQYTLYYFTGDSSLRDRTGEIFASTISEDLWTSGKISFVVAMDAAGTVVQDEALFKDLCRAAGAHSELASLPFNSLAIALEPSMDAMIHEKGVFQKLLATTVFAEQKVKSLFEGLADTTGEKRYLEMLRVMLAVPPADESRTGFRTDFTAYAEQQLPGGIKNASSLVGVLRSFAELQKQRAVYDGLDGARRILGAKYWEYLKGFSVARDIDIDASVAIEPIAGILVAMVDNFIAQDDRLSMLTTLSESVTAGRLKLSAGFSSALASVIREAKDLSLHRSTLILDALGSLGTTLVQKVAVGEAVAQVATMVAKKYGLLAAHGFLGVASSIGLGYGLAGLLFGLDGAYDNLQLAHVADNGRLECMTALKTLHSRLKSAAVTDVNEALLADALYGTYVALTTTVYHGLRESYDSSRMLKPLSDVFTTVLGTKYVSMSEYVEYFGDRKAAYEVVFTQWQERHSVSYAYRSFLQRTWLPPEGDTVASSTVLILDRSGSMTSLQGGQVKIDAARKAATDFLTLVERENSIGGRHQAGLVVFDDVADLLVPLGGDVAGTKALLEEVAPDGGETSVGDALNAALPELVGTDNPVGVLLTDGMTNTGPFVEEILTTIIQQYIDAGITLYTIGFGEPGDIDEDFLRQLAEMTGGEYFYADSAWNLRNIFIKARHQSLGTVKGEFEGVVSQGETIAAGTFEVTEQNAQLFVSVGWQGSMLDLILKDPSGRVVDAGYPGAQLFLDANPVYVIIDRPVAGTWGASVFGRDVPQATEAFNVLASVRTSEAVPSVNWTPLFLGLAIAGVVGGAVALVLLLTKGSTSVHGPLYYILITSGNVQRAIPVGKQRIHVGRAGDSDLVIADPLASGRHCDIFADQQSWVVQDLGSTNGTYVDGKKISVARVSSQNSIKIGTTVLRLTPTLPTAVMNRQPSS